jgi:hypothetical protein
MPRHIVEYSADGYLRRHEEIFYTQKDAVEFSENLPSAYKYVWLLEWGEYQTQRKNWVQSWIYYWWSPAVTTTDWGPCPDSGWGYPPSRRFLTKYRRKDYSVNSRHSYRNVRASPIKARDHIEDFK